jgi:hypothetical protein
MKILSPLIKAYLPIELKLKIKVEGRYLTIFITYVLFLIYELPSLIQLIGVPTILGSLLKRDTGQIALIPMGVSLLLGAYLVVKSYHYLGDSASRLIIVCEEDIERELVSRFWFILLFITCAFAGVLVGLIFRLNMMT